MKGKHSGWILPGILIGFYLVIKLQGWAAAQEVKSLERQLAEIRPGLSAIVLAEQLENTKRACEEVASRVRRLDLQNGQLLARIFGLPASITLSKVEMRSRLSLRVTRIQGTLLPGAREPETVLVQWVEPLRRQGAKVVIQKLSLSFETPGVWEFDLEVEDA